ncbi:MULTISPECIES: hypothetical protein [unclassified Streptomyces]|uniref:hypothetical protein n=1 Tax=unclassified Streptomyces TaxID=2593676 RepID=UPI002F910A98
MAEAGVAVEPDGVLAEEPARRTGTRKTQLQSVVRGERLLQSGPRLLRGEPVRLGRGIATNGANLDKLRGMEGWRVKAHCQFLGAVAFTAWRGGTPRRRRGHR